MKVRWAAGKPPPSLDERPEHYIDYTEGSWLELTGTSWMWSDRNPAALMYGARSGVSGLPTDDNVHYVHINGLGFLVHESELVEEEE